MVWTDRHGGVSNPPYDTANLACRSGDDPAAVRENRRRLAHRLGLPPPVGWWWLHQVHGAEVVSARGAPPAEMPRADAAVTGLPGLPLVALTADCAPLALACEGAAAAVHAGWQGLMAGVVEAALEQLRAVGSGDVRAALGPCIHPARYEFGTSDLARVQARLGPGVLGRTAEGTPALDLPAAVRAALARGGVDDCDDVGVCTAESRDHFSFRRDGETGRQALVVVLEA